MPDIKFSQLPDLPNPTPSTIIPVVEGGQNFTVTANTLQGFVNSTTGNVTAGNLITTGRVSATGNISGNFILGNGSQLTGIAATYGNANVATFLASFGSNAVSTTGNVTAGFLVGDGSQITNLPAGNYSNANVSAFLPTYTGNIGAGNISVTGTITGGNLLTAGQVSATGNITGSFFLGNGSQLTGINANYGNANVAAYLPTYTGAMPAMAGNVTTTANVQGAFVKGNGSALTGVVTSIVAGSGISVDQATGAVTITNTGGGGGGGSVISSGLNYANVGATNNRVLIQVGNATPTVTPATAADLLQIINQTGNSLITMPATGDVNIKVKDSSGIFRIQGGIPATALSVQGNGAVVCQSLNAQNNMTTAKIATTASYSAFVYNAGFQGPQLTKTGASNGTAGEICWDTNYIYVCTGANTWKRVALTAF
jgi:hypothetical protein